MRREKCREEVKWLHGLKERNHALSLVQNGKSGKEDFEKRTWKKKERQKGEIKTQRT